MSVGQLIAQCRHETAVHEAGHAVVAAALGGRILSCRIKDDLSGYFSYSGPDDLATEATVAYAGPPAEKKFVGEKRSLIMFGAERDLARVKAIARCFSPVPVQHRRFRVRCRRRALRLVDQYWTAIVTVAWILIADSCVSADVIEGIVFAARVRARA
jgi:hypothetical protein